jgi:hypothetical protein
MLKHKKITSVPMIAVAALLGVTAVGYSVSAFADTATSAVASLTTTNSGQNKRQPGVGGTITAIDGTNITITGKDSSVYVADVSAATYVKITEPTVPTTTTERPKPTITSIALGDIKVGDTVMIKGTVSGTQVTATEVAVGIFTGGPGGMMGHKGEASHDHAPEGEHKAKPAAAGIIQTVAGNTVTIKDRNSAIYTVDATSAKILKDSGTRGTAPVQGTIADLTVGNMLMAQGTLSGSTVVATEIVTGPQRQPTTK